MSFQNKHIQTVKDYARKFYTELDNFIGCKYENRFVHLRNITEHNACCHIMNNNKIKLRTTLYFNDGTNCGEYGFCIRFEIKIDNEHIGLELFSESDTPFDFSSSLNNEQNQIMAAAKHMYDYINQKFSYLPASPTSTPGDTASR